MAPLRTLHDPPFPPLTLQNSYWSGQVTLPAWAGALDCSGMFASGQPGEESDGVVNLSIACDDADQAGPPSAAQRAAFQYLLEHDAAVARVVRQALFDRYPAWREEFRDAWGAPEEAEDYLPMLESVDDVKTVAGLTTVHVLPVSRDDLAYVGLELGCTWDDEHGLGVMLHKDRVVDVGPGNTAFNPWIAKEDLENSG